MKIWKAELNLFYNFDEELQTNFRFELQDKEYEANIKIVSGLIGKIGLVKEYQWR